MATKFLVFILLTTAYACSNKISSEILEDLVEIENINNCGEIEFTNEVELHAKLDTDFIYNIYNFKYSNDILFTDSIEIVGYNPNCRTFNLEFSDVKFLVIENVFEFSSEYHFYIIEPSKVEKIGAINNIRRNCENCDALNYPLSDFLFQSNKNKIRIAFLNDLILVKDNMLQYKNKNTFYYEFIFATNQFKTIEF